MRWLWCWRCFFRPATKVHIKEMLFTLVGQSVRPQMHTLPRISTVTMFHPHLVFAIARRCTSIYNCISTQRLPHLIQFNVLYYDGVHHPVPYACEYASHTSCIIIMLNFALFSIFLSSLFEEYYYWWRLEKYASWKNWKSTRMGYGATCVMLPNAMP